MKKIILLAFITILTTLTLGESFANAQTKNIEYKVLAPLPGLTMGNCDVNNTNCVYTIEAGGTKDAEVGGNSLGNFLNTAYNYIVGISIALAVAMIIYGGVQYATADAANKTSKGRDTIESAIVGLLLVLGSFLILNTINSDLTRFDLGLTYGMLPEVSIQSPGTTDPNNPSTGSTTTPPRPGGTQRTSWDAARASQVVTGDAAIRTQLITAGVRIKTDNGTSQVCTTRLFEQSNNGRSINCLGLGGMPSGVASDLVSMQAECKKMYSNCSVYVTGGTEWGHSSHGPGNTAVDLAIGGSFDQYLQKISTKGGYWFGNCAYVLENKYGRFCHESIGVAAHWHAAL